MTGNKSPAIRPTIRQAICADRIAGMPVGDISRKYSVSRSSVSRTLAKFRKEVPHSALVVAAGDYRLRMRDKAITVVERALMIPLMRTGVPE